MRNGDGAFDAVRRVGLALPDVEAATKYDGSPVLKVQGCFMAGLAMHRSAEPDTLVVRANVEEREGLLEDAPETYYVTDYYRPHPVVLVRLSRIDRESLRDLLSASWRLAMAKTRGTAGKSKKPSGVLGLSGGRKVVGAKGFEPSTPRSRTECSTRLSHAPTPVYLNPASTSTNNSSTSGNAACAVRSGWSGVTET